MENPNKDTLEQQHKDPKNWKWGMFYYNPEDPRNMVPKRIQWMGITINFAKTKAVILLIGFLLFALFIIFMIDSKK